jgi:UDPglucose 6-dehydrogenase
MVRMSRDGLPESTQDKRAAQQPNLSFSTDVSRCISEADMVIIAVNTPTKSRGAGAGSATDMTAFEAVTAEVVQHARLGAIIVEKSTVPCRTAELVEDMVCLENLLCQISILTYRQVATHRPGAHFEILSNPEFLAAGTAVQDLLRPDRVIIGSASTPKGRSAAESLAKVYAAWVDRSKILTINLFSSELAKLVANSMLAQRLSSINSISAICEATGAEIREVATSIGSDSRIGEKFLRAGIGFGGSCFKKDVLSLVYLAESLGLKEVGDYWRQVVIMNEYQRNRFTSRVIKCLNNTLVNKKVTILGYAFKKNTSDTRDSPALEIVKTLLEENPREIAIFDPCCNPLVIKGEIRALRGFGKALGDDGGSVRVYTNAYEACAASNAVLVVTEFDEFRNTKTSSAPSTQAKPSPAPEARPLPSFTDEEHLNPEPACASNCPDCEIEKTTSVPIAVMKVYKPQEQLDWTRIAHGMRQPKWLFDGRCIIDAKEMTRLGIRVESIGSSGFSSVDIS